MLEGELEKAESKITEGKRAIEDADQSKTTTEGLQRKIALLEEELDAAEKNAKEVVEKYVAVTIVGLDCV